MGLVDKVVPPHKLMSAAESLALLLMKGKTPPKPKKTMGQSLMSMGLDENPLGRSVVFSKSKKMRKNRMDFIPLLSK